MSMFYFSIFFYTQPSSRPVKDSSTFWSMFDLELSNITPRRRRGEILQIVSIAISFTFRVYLVRAAWRIASET